MLGRVIPAEEERVCRGWLADGDVTWMLRTASPVEAGRLQLTARRVLREESAILEEAMSSCTGSTLGV